MFIFTNLKYRKIVIAAILVLAAFLRLFNIQAGDPIGDEVLYAFRALGPLDYDIAEFQTTPWQWYDGNIPWWAKLSFHDHPPLVFLIQNFFLKIFGENLFAFRLPSALFGIASVFLVYKIGVLIFSFPAGLVSALVLAVNVNHVLISRVGLQESYVIFFLLLFSYALISSLKKENFLWLVGISIGLGFLTKYTTIISVPVMLIYCYIFRRPYFLHKKFWLMFALIILISSPVLIYNYELYESAGHFDFQFSYIFGQNPEIWKVAPGKEEAGNLYDRVKNFIPGLLQSNSWLFTLVSAVGLVSVFKSRFLALVLFLLFSLIIGFIGPQLRFISMLIPFLSIGVGYMTHAYFQRFARFKTVFAGIFVLFIVFEIFYSVNSQILFYPNGKSSWFFSSQVRYENYNWGFNELGSFLYKEFSGKFPAFVLTPRYKFIREFQDKAVINAKAKGYEPYPALIIYDGNMLNGPQLWYLDRLQIYHGWPVLKTEEYKAILAEKGRDYFLISGFKNFYFIALTENIPLKKAERLTVAGSIFEKELIFKSVIPEVLKNKRGKEVFRVYKF